jgi:DNA (cytosine-5)-methyltransferase 1|tara:strand:- start:790 stop:1974 length:1185 start_codon:yes stop_codon:yes gene_type:complete
MDLIKNYTFRLGELFSGPGGLGCGAKLASVRNGRSNFTIKHSWATDYDRDSCNSYYKNILKDKNAILCKDIRKLDFQKLKNISDVDAISFGFPCNDFSVVGEQKGINGVYGPLYSYCVEALNFFKPKWFLAENVGGLRNSNDGRAFELILDEMFNSGYSLYPHLYKFEKYGIPQNRHRIIIIGIRKDIDIEFKIPSPTLYSHINNSSKNAIENPPIKDDDPHQIYTKQSKTVIERLDHIKPGQNAFTADLPEHLRLNVKSAKISQIYKRLEADKPAYTVTGSGGGGTHVYHWKENRALTNRERARLQTFPDNFNFCGSKESVRKQIGMAVPVQGAKIIFESVLKCFAGIPYETTDPNIENFKHSNKFIKSIIDEPLEKMFLFKNEEKFNVVQGS